MPLKKPIGEDNSVTKKAFRKKVDTTKQQATWCCQTDLLGAARPTCLVLPDRPAWCCQTDLLGAARPTCLVLPDRPAWCCQTDLLGAARPTLHSECCFFANNLVLPDRPCTQSAASSPTTWCCQTDLALRVLLLRQQLMVWT